MTTHRPDIDRRSRPIYRARETERLLERCSPPNRAELQFYLAYLEGRGRTIGTRRSAAFNLAQLDRLVNGRAIVDLGVQDLTLALAAYARTHSGNSVHTFAAYIKAFYSWKHDGETPRAIKRALSVGKGKPRQNIVPLTEDEREALALRIGSVQFDDQGGAHLVLTADAPELKNGPRTIYVVDCVPALRVWLAMHSKANDATAPVFCHYRDGSRQIPAYLVNMILDQIVQSAEMRNVWPRLFRHTRVTRAARGDPKRAIAGWNDAQMRAYFAVVFTRDNYMQSPRSRVIPAWTIVTLEELGGDAFAASKARAAMRTSVLRRVVEESILEEREEVVHVFPAQDRAASRRDASPSK